MLIATPISHLFKLEPEIQKIIDASDCFECRDASFESTIVKQRIYHSDFELIHTWTDREKKMLSSIQSTKEELELISFHAASCYSRPVIIDGIFQPEGIEYSREDMIANTRENIRTIRNIFGNSIEIAVENNNYYPTPVYKTITDSSFLSTIVNENNIAFLFDIAHAKVTAHNRNICFDEYTEGLPLNRCVQLHISEFGINSRGIAYDVHEEPGRELYACIKNLLSRYRKIKYVTVEYYKSIDRLLFIIRQIKEIVISL